MNPALFAQIAAGFTQAFRAMSQPVTLAHNRTAQAMVDDLPYAEQMRKEGGGLEQDFTGNIVFLKADFPVPGTEPKIGDRVTLGPGRIVALKAIDGKFDAMDPFLTYGYWPKDR